MMKTASAIMIAGSKFANGKRCDLYWIQVAPYLVQSFWLYSLAQKVKKE